MNPPDFEKIISRLLAFESLGVVAPVFVVQDLTGLSRSRVVCLVETGVFQSLRQSGYLFVRMNSVLAWYSQRASKARKRKSAGKLRGCKAQ